MNAQDKQWFEARFDQLQIRQVVQEGYLRDLLRQNSALKELLISLQKNPKMSALDVSRLWAAEVERYDALHDKILGDIYESSAEELRKWKQDHD